MIKAHNQFINSNKLSYFLFYTSENLQTRVSYAQMVTQNNPLCWLSSTPTKLVDKECHKVARP